MDMILFDIDNCISDDAHRLHMIRGEDFADRPFERYHAYHSLSPFDEPCNLDRVTAHRASSPAAWIVFVTARPEWYRYMTNFWLRNVARIPHRMLMMRGNDDFRSSMAVKVAMAEELLAAGDRILMAYDDREDVLDGYKQLGIRCEQLAINNHPAHAA